MDGLAFRDPIGELVDLLRRDAARIGAALAHPVLHRLEENPGTRPITREQEQVGISGLLEPIQGEVGFGAIFDRG